MSFTKNKDLQFHWNLIIQASSDIPPNKDAPAQHTEAIIYY